MAPLHLFINLYYHELQATNAQIGLAFALQSFAEAPIFFIAGHMINKYGAPKIILVSIIITAIRVFLYSQADTPWQAIPFGLLHGLTFSLFWAAAIQYMQSLIPQQLRGTGQALLWAFHLGAGVTIGNILMGYLYETLGMRMVMKFNGFYAIIMLFCFFFYFKWKSRQRSSADHKGP